MKHIQIIALSLVLVIFSASNAFAQRFYEGNLYNFNWGYGSTSASFEVPKRSNMDFSFRHYPLSYEYMSRNAYFHSDLLTPMIDLCLGAFNSEYWYGHREGRYVFNGGDWPLARLGFGGFIGEEIGIYGGAQWSYSRWEVFGESTGVFLYDQVNKKEYGGHLFGPGLHTVFNTDRFLVRGSFMYDFVTQGFKGPRYTNAITVDIMAMYGLTSENLFGIFANYVYQTRSDMNLTKFRIGLALNFQR